MPDVLDPNGPGPALAEAFGSAITDTLYFREHMFGTSAIPREALEELGKRACLCRLPDCADEQALLRQALFEPPAPGYAEATKQRCRSFALLLRELEREPEAADSNGVFMQAVWDDFLADPAGDGALRRPSPSGRRSQRRTGGKSRCHRSGPTSCAWPGCPATACRRTSSTPFSAPNSFRRGRSTSWAEHLKSRLRPRRRRLPTRSPRGRRIFHSTSCGGGLPRPTQPQPVSFCSSPCAAESQPRRPHRRCPRTPQDRATRIGRDPAAWPPKFSVTFRDWSSSWLHARRAADLAPIPPALAGCPARTEQ